MPRDYSLQLLLDLDGQVLVLDEEARYWVRFVVTRIAETEAKPHGIDYSLTLHGPDGERLVGYDNAHQVADGSGPGKKRATAQDHKHRLHTIRPYGYSDAATLLEDFWNDVRSVLNERGVSI